jgi:hypothetical protein
MPMVFKGKLAGLKGLRVYPEALFHRWFLNETVAVS